jgi:hypothetical protein
VTDIPPKEVMKQMSSLCGFVAENNLAELKNQVEKNKIDPK